MKGRTCNNYLSQAFANLWKNRIMSFMATATIVFCLLLLGISVILGFDISYISVQLEGQYEIHAYIDLSYTEQQAKDLQEEIKKIRYIDEAQFISKDDALMEMERGMQESASAFEMLRGDENPLPHTYNITLTNVRQANNVVEKLKAVEGVEDVKNRSDMLNKIVKTTRGMQYVSIAAMAIFAFVGIFIISNTIKMSLAARNREIEIMKYVGATDWYIRWPFIIEGIIMGIIASLIAFIPVYFAYSSLVSWWNDTVPMFDLLTMKDLQWLLIGTFASIGCILGAFGSIISIRKHLRV